MEKLELLMIHCTATRDGQAVTAKDIRRWHTSPPPGGRGWNQVGYSDMIHLNGMLENLVQYDADDVIQPRELTNGATGLNQKARHVVYVGGMDADGRHAMDTRTPAQRMALANYVRQVVARYPNIKVLGHNQVASKACPSFDVPTWLRAIGIDEKNIYKK